MDADVVSLRRGARWRAVGVGEAEPEVLLLEDLPDPLGAPVGHEELQAGVVAGPPVAVVAEEPGDPCPDVGHQVHLDEGAEALAEVRVRTEAPAGPEVEAGRAVVAADADEGDVVDLVLGALLGAAGDRGLELAREVLVLGIADEALMRGQESGRRIEQLPRVDARQRAPDHRTGAVTACLARRETHAFDRVEDPRHVLDADPVELDVLAVGHVRDVPPEALRDPGDRAELFAGQAARREADPHHEELVLELVRLRGRRPAPRDPLAALGVDAPPAEPSPQVVGPDGPETLLRVDVVDAVADLEGSGVPLRPLILVERLPVAERPLPLPEARHGG